MYTYINKAIQAQRELYIKLDDGSKLSGMPTWGINRSRVKIKASDIVVWIPLGEILHVTMATANKNQRMG